MKGSAHSDEHGTLKKIADEFVSLHTPDVVDHLEDESDVSAYREKQEKHITSSEACSEPDASLELCISNSLTATVNGVGNDENRSKSPDTGMTSSMDELDSYHGTTNKKNKKRVRRLQLQLTWEGVDGDLPANIVKFWCQRSNHAIAIDIDPQKIDYARHNATIYGVSDGIHFITSDFFWEASRLKGGVFFMSPPWGGPDYNKVQACDIETMLRPHDGRYLFQIARMIASKIVMFLPRNIDLNQLAELSLSVDPPLALEVEKNFLNGRLKAITAYFDNPS